MRANGEIYEGHWNNGLKHGKGTQSSPEVIFTGEWVDGKVQGFGKLILIDGSYSYEGHFENDKPHGEGTVTYPTGHKLIGRNRGGLPLPGYGVLESPDGTKYEFETEKSLYIGAIQNEKKHGFGILFRPEGGI